MWGPGPQSSLSCLPASPQSHLLVHSFNAGTLTELWQGPTTVRRPQSQAPGLKGLTVCLAGGTAEQTV